MSRNFPTTNLARRQRGVAGMMAMIFLLVVVGFSAVTLLNMSSSDLQDTTAQNDGIAALFLAESGIERASQLFSSGTACSGAPSVLQQPATNYGRGSLGPTAAVPVIQVGAPPGVPPGSYPDSCRVEVQGRVGLTTRTIQADLQRGPALGDITYLSVSAGTTGTNLLQWNHTIAAAAGSNRIVVVGVSIRGAGVSVLSGTYNGVTMAKAGGPEGLPAPTVNGTVRVEWLFAINPPTGTRQIRVILSGAARAVAGALAFSGVDPVNPINAVAADTGNYLTNPAVNITPVTNKAWIVDVLAVQLNTTVAVGSGQTNPATWRLGSGGGAPAGVYGAGSYRGPVTPIATVPIGWTRLTPPPVPLPTNAWAHSVLALRPVPLLHITRWTEL